MQVRGRTICLNDIWQTGGENPGSSFKTIAFQFDDTNAAEMTFWLSFLHRSLQNWSVIIYTRSTLPFKFVWALFIISHMEHFPTQSKLWKKDSAWAYARQNVLYWKKWLFALPTCLFNFASKVANINCQELQKHLTGKRLARRRRRELLCSSSLPEETPHRTEIGTRSGASCNWPAAAVEGSTSCFCPALPHCCSL